MNLHRSPDERPAAGCGPSDHIDRMSRVPAIAHDDDERPSIEDRDYGQTIFTRPGVKLPRVLRRRPRR